jgi:RNA polymerase sigma-70 factor (ECF subfamily)
VAHAVVADIELAEDVCQDAMFRVWKRLAECRDPDRFGAWLARAVHRHALNALRHRRGEPLEGFHLATPSPGPDVRAEQADLSERLGQALKQLAPAQREAVVLFDMEGWSHGEIAAVLDTSEAMSRQHLMLGRRRLRELLEGKEGHHDR